MKQSRYIVLLTFFLLQFSSTNLKAQNNAETEVLPNQIGVSLGYNQGFVKDLNFSALNYHANGLLYSLDYIRHQPNGKGILTLDLDVSLGDIQTKVSDYFTSNSTLVNVEVSYLRNLNLNNEKWKAYLGGQYNTFLQVLDWNDLESFSFLATHGIGVKALTSYQLNDKSWLQTSIFLPVLQKVVRPPYNGIDEYIIENQDNTLTLLFTGDAASFNTYFAFDWKVNYILALSRKLDWKVSYLLRYQNVNEINRFRQLQNQITTGISLKF